MHGRWTTKRFGSGVLRLLLILPFGLVADRAAAACVGDCDGDGVVAINELIIGVNIGLGLSPVESCPAFDPDGDGTVGIADVITGVGNGLEGCPPVATAGIVFSGENNRLNAYDPADGFTKQTVIERRASDPEGLDINGQVCFRRGDDGEMYFIAGEDTGQNVGIRQGWGWFLLEGDSVGNFQATQLGKLAPTYQTADDNAENFGCGFLSDGRLLLSDVGNQAAGPLNGQLIVWFPPFDVEDPAYCKIDIAIGTAGQIAVDDEDRVYVASSRGDPGVFVYSGDFPTSNDAAGGCGRQDSTGAPLVDEGRVLKEKFISDPNIATANGVVLIPGGGFYVSSVITGVIAEFDAEGQFVRRILEPPAGMTLPPFPTGTPLGLGIASDGTLYYADLGLEVTPTRIGPGRDAGTVRRIRFVDGEPQAPETMDTGLNFPDGLGILEE
jgi:hypothetical protein